MSIQPIDFTAGSVKSQPDVTINQISADATLYLRHVEGGESIRALAREAGCHASTMMRRIRRIEARRDDPLVDRALTGPAERTLANDRRQTVRLLRRLAEPEATLAVSDGMDKAIITRGDIRTAILDRAMAEQFALEGWVAPFAAGRVARYRITSAGRAALKARINKSASAVPRAQDFAGASKVEASANGNATAYGRAEQHRIYEDKMLTDPESGRPHRMRVNIAESPLLLASRRKMPDGKPLLSGAMVAAGERLREDFELAQMGARVAQNWDRFLTSGIDESRGGVSLGGGSTAARDRVADALRELGPGMGDLVLRVCCHLDGLEMTERRLGWSARSGKVVLRLALQRLDRHYVERYGHGKPMIG